MARGRVRRWWPSSLLASGRPTKMLRTLVISPSGCASMHPHPTPHPFRYAFSAFPLCLRARSLLGLSSIPLFFRDPRNIHLLLIDLIAYQDVPLRRKYNAGAAAPTCTPLDRDSLYHSDTADSYGAHRYRHTMRKHLLVSTDCSLSAPDCAVEKPAYSLERQIPVSRGARKEMPDQCAEACGLAPPGSHPDRFRHGHMRICRTLTPICLVRYTHDLCPLSQRHRPHLRPMNHSACWMHAVPCAGRIPSQGRVGCALRCGSDDARKGKAL